MYITFPYPELTLNISWSVIDSLMFFRYYKVECFL